MPNGRYLNPRPTRAEVDAIPKKRVVHFAPDGTVTRISRAPAAAALDPASQVEHAGGRVGDRWDGASFTPGRRTHPKRVTRASFMREIARRGKMGQLRAGLAQQGQDSADLFNALTILEREDPIITDLATRLGMTQDQMDEAFVRAGRAG